ncbi:MAG: RsmB/NOP family class I SAM-dependent RNA methyltransferase [archaeon]
MKHNYQPKPLFVERMKELLGRDYEKYTKKILEKPVNSIRANTLKISPEKLKKQLEKKWEIKQPFKDFPEIMIVEGKYADEKSVGEDTNINNDFSSEARQIRGGGRGRGGLKQNKLIPLEPGELGRCLEHLLGYYYIQELASMLPALVLKPKENEHVLDLCASPGSKTTQIAAMMNNSGTVIANEINFKRTKILSSNLERCGVSNTIITRKNGIDLCRKLKEKNFLFDKILVDAPCSGEGTVRSTPKTFLMWNIHAVKSLSKLQKKLLSSAIEILKTKGEIVYSTCTHSPEENEEVLDFILREFSNIKIEKINLPVKCSPGILGWAGGNYNKEVENSCRIYPHISDTEGFFIAKLTKLK